MFTYPFFMADTNAPVVRRAHALAGHPWGADFEYRELASAPGSAAGFARAVITTGVLGGVAAAMKRPKLRDLLHQRAPKPGEGPSLERRTRGHWKVRFVAEHGDEHLVFVAADEHGDPGYGSTSKMLGESAMCLAYDALASPGGVLTASTAMNGALLARLRAAGLSFVLHA